VVALLVRSFPAHRIAGELSVSPRTVRRHTERIYAKLGVRPRSDLAAMILG
jgi:DNA-binding NarL/FixJ family response regulator